MNEIIMIVWILCVDPHLSNCESSQVPWQVQVLEEHGGVCLVRAMGKINSRWPPGRWMHRFSPCEAIYVNVPERET